MSRPLTGFVLTGGKSSRMGTDKALLRLADGETLLEHAVALLSSLTSQVRLIGSRERYLNFVPAEAIVEDIFPGQGPLGGIHAGLVSSKTDLNLVLAVDTPRVTSALLEFLLSRAQASQALVVVPEIEGRYQTLCAIYRKEFHRQAEQSLRAGQNKVSGAFDPANLLVVPQSEIEAAGFSPSLFQNLNTVEEFANFNSVAKSQ